MAKGALCDLIPSAIRRLPKRSKVPCCVLTQPVTCRLLCSPMRSSPPVHGLILAGSSQADCPSAYGFRTSNRLPEHTAGHQCEHVPGSHCPSFVGRLKASPSNSAGGHQTVRARFCCASPHRQLIVSLRWKRLTVRSQTLVRLCIVVSSKLTVRP